MARLRLVRSPEGTEPPVGTVFPLAADRTVIGRDGSQVPPGDGFIPAVHLSVSRQHAAITRTDAGYVLTDLASRSGVYVNCRCHKRDHPALLADGDQIKICDYVFVFEAGDAPKLVTPRPSSDSPSPRA